MADKNRPRTLRARVLNWSLPELSVNALKILGAGLTALYYFSATVVQTGILHVTDYTPEELSALMNSSSSAMVWGGVGSIATAVGIMALPIYTYLLVQGALHTRNMGRYLLSVLVFAVLAEVPYDLAMFGRPWDLTEQNSLWTVFIALVMLWLMKTFQGKGAVPVILNILFLAAGCFWAIVLNCKFGGGFVLITAVLFWLRDHKKAANLTGAVISAIYASAFIGFVPVAMCSGERRQGGAWQKYAYYAFYPVMLALFALWMHLL